MFPIEPKKTGDEFLTDLADEDNMILTPHIGGSTLEAQKSIGQFVSQRLEDYWFKGSTMLSVNLPQITPVRHQVEFPHRPPACESSRVLARVNRVLGEDGINIAAQALGTEGEIGYVVTDVAQRPDQRALTACLHRGYDPHARDQLEHAIRNVTILRAGFQPSVEPARSLFAVLLTDATPSHAIIRTCALQIVDGPLEVLQILEILVDVGEAMYATMSKSRSGLKNRLADLIRFDLASPRERRSSSTFCPSIFRSSSLMGRPGMPCARRKSPYCGRIARRFRNASRPIAWSSPMW